MIPKKKTPRTPKAAPSPSDEVKQADRPVAARRRPATTKRAVAPKAVAPRPAARKSATSRKGTDAKTPLATSKQTAVVVTDDDIRIRAYFLSLEYRGHDRNHVDFWLLAERELRGK